MRRRLLYIFLLPLMAVSCGEDEVVSEPVIRPVRYVRVFASGGERERLFTGTSRAALESKLSFKVGGTVSQVVVKVGDRVKVGQLIASLDPKDYQLQVQDAEASLASVQAQARNAKANYSRVSALYENRNASRNDLDAARTGFESARASVESVKKKLEIAQLQKSYTRLQSPVNGSIASMQIDENENVSPGQPVAMLTSGSQLEVEVAIPEALIAQIREGDAVHVKFDALAGKTFSGLVTEVGITSVGMATTFPVVVRMTDTDSDCRPGMAAEVVFKFGGADKRERMVVPAVAVGEDRSGRYVFVVEPQANGLGVTKRKTVSVGELTEGGLEIFEGLTDGEFVVTAGVSRIEDGQTVRLPAAN